MQIRWSMIRMQWFFSIRYLCDAVADSFFNAFATAAFPAPSFRIFQGVVRIAGDAGGFVVFSFLWREADVEDRVVSAGSQDSFFQFGEGRFFEFEAGEFSGESDGVGAVAVAVGKEGESVEFVDGVGVGGVGAESEFDE